MRDAVTEMEQARSRWARGGEIVRDGVLRFGPDPISQVVYVRSKEQKFISAAYWRALMKTLPKPGTAIAPPQPQYQPKPAKKLIHWRFFERGSYFDIVEDE